MIFKVLITILLCALLYYIWFYKPVKYSDGVMTNTGYWPFALTEEEMKQTYENPDVKIERKGYK